MTTQDELIQAELDGTIEQMEANQTADDEQPKEETHTDEQVVEQQTEQKEAPKVEPDTTTKKTDSVVKLLKQRNEARAEVESLKAQIKDKEDLESRLKELEESIATKTLEEEAAKEKKDFYAANPRAVGHEADIEKIAETKDLTLNEAFQLYAAQNDPTLLLDEQYKNKQTSSTTLTGVASIGYYKENPTAEDFAKMSDDEFLKWSDSMAMKDRRSKGYTN